MASEDTISQISAPPPITDPPVLREEIFQKLEARFLASGRILMPCVPALLEYYLNRIAALLQATGQKYDQETLSNMSQKLRAMLDQGWQASPYSRLIIKYEPAPPPRQSLIFNLSIQDSSLADRYKEWIDRREAPLFGTHPDAKLMAVAAELGEPATVKVLDVGAGTGRNTIPLGKLGYAVDALELTPAFVEQLQAAVQAEGLQVQVIQGDILDPHLRMRPANYQLAIMAEVISHFGGVEQLRLSLAKMCDVICSGGLFLFSLFLATDDYEPDRATREMSQVAWSYIFTRRELAAALYRLPMEVISDESVFEYECKHLPMVAWPPTGWFIDWSKGRNLFTLDSGLPPMELRWILCRRL